MARSRSLPERPKPVLGFVPLAGTSPRVTTRADGPQVLITVISGITDMIYLCSDAFATGVAYLTAASVTPQDLHPDGLPSRWQALTSI
jgi:hypothetical protein